MIKAAFLMLMGLTVSASAIVVQDYTTAEAPPSSLDWDHVYYYKGASAVAVGDNWLLTAAHVAVAGGTGTVSGGGMVYSQQEIVLHPSADLALVRYDNTFPGYYPLYTDGLLFDPRLTVILVGFGTKGSVSNFGWTDNGTGRGTKRWGTQEIDRTTSDGFWMDFDLVNTPYEAGVGVGDSGSGVFYDDGGVWKLAGINVQRALIGGQYKQTLALGMGSYADWIADTIPEPVTTNMVGLGTIGLFLMRAGTRRKSVYGCLPSSRTVFMCDQFSNTSEKQRFRVRFYRYLIERGRGLEVLVQPAVQRIYTRYKAYDTHFWNYMVAAHERRTVRRQVTKIAIKRKTLGWLDSCLERILK